MVFYYKWPNTFLFRMLRRVYRSIKNYMMLFKQIKLGSKSFLCVDLRKNWGRQNVALYKPFNFYLKHFLIFWIINEKYKKKDFEIPWAIEKFLSKNSTLY